MAKHVLLFFVVVIVAFLISYFSHYYVLEKRGIQLSFLLEGVYFFYAISAILIYLSITIIFEKIPNNVGYAFLALMFVKIGFFLILFRNIIFSEIPIVRVEKISLIIPFMLFLSIETVFVAKLLNNK